jgi:hypothetical protein
MSLTAPEIEPAGAARPTAPTARPTPDPFIGAIIFGEDERTREEKRGGEKVGERKKSNVFDPIILFATI